MLPLPSLWAEEPVILASTEAPPQATAGDPFTYSVRIENPGNVLQVHSTPLSSHPPLPNPLPLKCPLFSTSPSWPREHAEA